MNENPQGTDSAQAEAEPAVGAQIPQWKRSLDIVLVSISLPCWIGVMGVIALWIKTVSPGPILYRQERVGYLGRRFQMLKFRSMRVDVDTSSHEHHLAELIGSGQPMTKLDELGDNRLVRGGRLLRASGLDELPQIFNVIRGDMSLVGPRPCTPFEFERYQSEQRARVNVLPGLTGYWQVSGKNKTTFAEMIAMDLLYARRLSLWMDLKIILKTGSAITAQIVAALAGRKRRPENVRGQT